MGHKISAIVLPFPHPTLQFYPLTPRIHVVLIQNGLALAYSCFIRDFVSHIINGNTNSYIVSQTRRLSLAKPTEQFKVGKLSENVVAFS